MQLVEPIRFTMLGVVGVLSAGDTGRHLTHSLPVRTRRHRVERFPYLAPSFTSRSNPCSAAMAASS